MEADNAIINDVRSQRDQVLYLPGCFPVHVLCFDRVVFPPMCVMATLDWIEFQVDSQSRKHKSYLL